jgi:rhodanese-related sulfurtransferase
MPQLLVSTANAFFWTVDKICAAFGRVRVPEVSVDELRSLRSGESGDLVLVDVRAADEYEVSVIPGAITKEQFEADEDRYRDRQVVAYCTVGGRSFMYARQLVKRGFNAANFKASILGWCEAELDLVTLDGTPTNRVHVYSPAFSVPDRYVAVTARKQAEPGSGPR